MHLQNRNKTRRKRRVKSPQYAAAAAGGGEIDFVEMGDGMGWESARTEQEALKIQFQF